MIKIEAQNLQHLRYGNAAAQDLTLQFWISSPKSGTHCVALHQPDGNRSYVVEFTVASADTAESFSMTIPGDTSGTINDDNGRGLIVTFPLHAGTDWEASADAWTAGQFYCTSNQQNLLDNTANNIYITGVQLEVGDTATDFEHEHITITYTKCLRYYEVTDKNTEYNVWGLGGYTWDSGQAYGFVRYQVKKRSVPTATGNGNSPRGAGAYSGSIGTSVSFSARTVDECVCFYNSGSGLTPGQSCITRSSNSTSDFTEFDAEL